MQILFSFSCFMFKTYVYKKKLEKEGRDVSSYWIRGLLTLSKPWRRKLVSPVSWILNDLLATLVNTLVPDVSRK